MKFRIYTLGIIAGMLLGITGFAAATTFTVGNLSYTVLTEDPAEVSVQGKSTSETTGDIVIPSTVTHEATEYQVSKIAAQGFSGYTNITSVNIPPTISIIGGGAFQGCTKLKKVYIHPQSRLMVLNSSTFSGCTKLALVTLPGGITEIKTDAFGNCSVLTQIIAYSATAPSSIATSAFTGVTKENITVKVLSTSAKTSFEAANYFKAMKEVVVMPVELDENGHNIDTLAKYNGLVADVHISRDLKVGGWNTLCLPFDMNAAQISASLGTCDIEALTDASVSASELELQFGKVTAIEAGVPYLVQVDAAASELNVANVTLQTGVEDVWYGGVQFIGIYNPTVLAASNDLVYVAGNSLYCSSGGTLGGLRAYFDISGVPEAAHSSMRMSFGGTTTGMPCTEQQNGCVKKLENGVIVIEREGVKYSVMGERL